MAPLDEPQPGKKPVLIPVQTMSSPEPRVPVGVGAVVVVAGSILLGRRKGSTGSGTWALPGGWLEPGESFDACAKRELEEETGITQVTGSATLPFVSNNYFSKEKCSVTIFVSLFLAEGTRPEPQLREPESCHEWRWHDLKEPLPLPLFGPLESLTVSKTWQTEVLKVETQPE